MTTLCLVEDDPIMGESLHDRFELEGFEVDWFSNARAARAALAERHYDAVVSDLRLPDLSGEELLVQRQQLPRACPPFLFITAYGSIEHAVDLLKLGACDYVTKPFDIGELVAKVRRAAGHAPPSPPPVQTAMLGVSAQMHAIENQLPRLAARARTVLISGASGVGKEVVARELHRLAAGATTAPFVAVNCGAIPDTLMEAAFFGHERGAFTGADRQRKGYLEQAAGGTLFLDEIGELPLLMQVKLLRVLQDRSVQRVGGEASLPVDFRVVCATHQDLRAAVVEGRFRDDLYYRINVVQVHLPPLADRPDDILWLAQRFVAEIATAQDEPARELLPAAQAALLAHPWPGNARELRNVIERACVMSDQLQLRPADLFGGDAGVDAHSTAAQAEVHLLSLEDFMANAERAYLQAALRRCGGKVGAAAAALGISRKTLWEKSKRHGIGLPD